MLTSGGVHGVRVDVVDAIVCEKSDETEVGWYGVSSNTQITVWRACNVFMSK